MAVVSTLLVDAMTFASDSDNPLEEVVVTGSRIALPDFESASPMVTVSQQMFERTGSNSVESTLNQLPQFVPAVTSTSNNPGNNGMSNVSLRGFGPNAGLVLLDGRRLMPGDGFGAVDLNLVPPDLVQSVEILTGGASAVYGSDAVAGVVNIRLKTKYDGAALSARYSETTYGDGNQYGFGLTAGTPFGQGRGEAMGYLAYSNRDLVSQGDRRFSRYALGYFPDQSDGVGPGGAFLAQGSTTIEEGRASRISVSDDVFNALLASYGYAPGTVPNQKGFGFNSDGTLFTTGDGKTPGSVANFRGEKDPVLFNNRLYTYNFAPDNALQLPRELWSAFGRTTFDLSSAATLFLQGLYTSYQSSRVLAPAPASNLRIPVTNPYIPKDLATLLAARDDPTAPFRFDKRMTEFGPRKGTYSYDALQVTAGLEGRVFNDWRYEAYVQQGSNDQHEDQTGVGLRSKFEELTFAPDGGQAICGGFNPFGKGSISPACEKFVSVDIGSDSLVQQTVAEASVSGPVFGLPAGDVHTAFGIFYKRDSFRYKADPLSRRILPDGRGDVISFQPSDDIDASESNTDLYIEARVPLLRDVPGVDALDLGLGYRHSEYQQAGGFDTYKAEFTYRPGRPLLLRGSYQHAVRAPSINELFTPQLAAVYTVAPDPCSVSSSQRQGPDAAKVASLCLKQGVPAGLLPTFDFEGDVEGYAGGNPDLTPETADTYTVGFVFTSPFSQPALAHLQASLDWYDIRVADIITTFDVNSFLDKCYSANSNPGFDPANFWCSAFGRDPATGEIVGLNSIDRNSGVADTSGVDLEIDWHMDAGPGQVGILVDVGYVAEWTNQPPGSPQQKWLGFDSACLICALPKWKSLFSIDYQQGGAWIEGRWHYIDSMRDDPVHTFEIPAYNYFDVSAGLHFDDGVLAGTALTAGVENLTNKAPPIFPNYVQANTDPSQYDVLGRRYYVSMTYRF